MAKRQQSKYKIDRRLRVNLWGRPKSPINKREYGPGQHGQGRQKRAQLPETVQHFHVGANGAGTLRRKG